MLKLDSGLLVVDDTRIVVGGHAEDSDGKTAAGVRTIALDPFTLEALRNHLAMLDDERRAFGSAYPAHGKLMCWPDGTPLHPDTVTRTFNRLVDRANVPRIRLHDVRHTYATLSLDHGIDPKIVSDRVGHSDVSVLFQVYTHRSAGHDRDAAELLARLMQEALTRRRGSS